MNGIAFKIDFNPPFLGQIEHMANVYVGTWAAECAANSRLPTFQKQRASNPLIFHFSVEGTNYLQSQSVLVHLEEKFDDKYLIEILGNSTKWLRNMKQLQLNLLKYVASHPACLSSGFSLRTFLVLMAELL